jgi:hypothetical protein
VTNLTSPTASEDAGIEPKTVVELALTSDGLTMLKATTLSTDKILNIVYCTVLYISSNHGLHLVVYYITCNSQYCI